MQVNRNGSLRVYAALLACSNLRLLTRALVTVATLRNTMWTR